MKILSIHPGHNSTVALMESGEIIGVLSQEKLDLRKNSAAFPKEAILVLLEQVGWDIESIERVIIASETVDPVHSFEYLFSPNQEAERGSGLDLIELAKRAEKGLAGKLAPKVFEIARSRRASQLKSQGKAELHDSLEKLGFGQAEVIYVNHHLCHGRAAFHSSKFAASEEPTLVFTLDGSGDGICATVSIASRDKWEKIAETPMEHSLGGIYSNTTKFLGMNILEHEYKVMGLAPYAKDYFLKTYEKIFKPIIDLDPENPLKFKSRVDTTKFYHYLCGCAVGQRFDNIAAAVQFLVEDLVIRWIKEAVKQTGVRKAVFGGGVFMNVKLNQRINEMKELSQVFFMPSCGDESNPIGACYDYSAKSKIPTKPLKNLFLGVGYSRDELGGFVDSERLNEKYIVEQYENIDEKIAQLLAEKEIVARFSDRCEWGARSLGCRAILAHPSYMESFYMINDYIKCRDFWMPFAPSILEEYADDYLVGYSSDKYTPEYMICTYQASERGVTDLRAAIHQGDQTLRPQVVKINSNPAYHALIKKFSELTGVGGVLNTSFNLHGSPLVATPDHAIYTLENSKLNYLALGDFLVKKRHN